MNASVRLMPTKLAAAALAAGVIAAGSSIGAAQQALPTIEAKVANASLITDALESVGWFVDGVAGSVAIPIEAAVSLPFDALTAIAISVQRPDYAPSVLSWLVNRYVNPSEAYPYYTYPWDFKANAIGNIAFALPYPLGPSTTEPGLINAIADGLATVIGNALAGLPDAAIGVAATDAFWATPIGSVLKSVNYVPLAPVWALWDVADYVGFLPANVEGAIESAIKTPQNIPGLLSSLVYDLLGSEAQGGLAGYLIHDLSFPLTTLPGPIGQFSTNLVANLQQGLENLLSILPAPIAPTPFAAKKAAGAVPVPTAAVQGTGATDIPATNGPSANAVTLTVSDTPKAPDAPKTPETSDAPKAPEVAKDLDAPKAADTPDTPKAPENKPDAPAVDTPAAGTTDKTDKPVGKSKSGKTKSGNKVRPGTKAAQGGAATGDSGKSTAPESTPGGADKPAGGAHADSTGAAA